ncbi:MAG: DUF1616 domain-containing protein [Candidatus Doudnabacteria bacterium]
MAYDDRVRRENWEMPTIDADLWIVIGYTLVVVATIYLPVVNETIIRSALGLGLILFIPGYSLIAALFPDNRDIDWIERLGLSFGLSIGVSSLVGMALNFTPWSIRLDPIVICLSLFTIVCAVVANKRRHELRPEDRFNKDLGKVWENVKTKMFPDGEDRLDKALTIMLVLAIITTIATFAYVVMSPRQGELFTELYVLGPDGQASNYPQNYNLGDAKPVIAGVINHEGRSTSYDLMVVLNNSTTASQLYFEQFMLDDNRTWEKSIEIKPDRIGNNMKLEFLLFKDGNTAAAYLDTHIWINVSYPLETS